MLTIPDKSITVKRLVGEFAAAGLPRLRGIFQSNREIDADGHVVLDAEGKPKTVPRYMLLKCDLTPSQEQLAKDIVTVHTPDTVPTQSELDDVRKERQLDEPFNKAMVSAFSNLTGNDEATVRAAVKVQL